MRGGSTDDFIKVGYIVIEHPAALKLLLLNFDCASGGQPTVFAGIGHVAQVRIV